MEANTARQESKFTKKLPAEIRNAIYEYALTCDGLVYLKFWQGRRKEGEGESKYGVQLYNDKVNNTERQASLATYRALSLTNRQLRNESKPIFFTTTKFSFSHQNLELFSREAEFGTSLGISGVRDLGVLLGSYSGNMVSMTCIGIEVKKQGHEALVCVDDHEDWTEFDTDSEGGSGNGVASEDDADKESKIRIAKACLKEVDVDVKDGLQWKDLERFLLLCIDCID